MNNKNLNIVLKVGNPPVNKKFTYEEVFQIIRRQLDQAQYAAAASLSERVARTFPTDLPSQLYAAESFLLNREPYRAIEFAERAQSLSKDPAPALFVKARIAVQLNNHLQAISCLDKMISLHGSNSDYYYERGDTYMTIGDIDKARDDYVKAIDLNVKHVKSLLKLSQLSNYEISDELLARVESMVKSGKLDSLQQTDAHFALANIYAKKTNLDKQFKHLHAGNRIACDSYQYDPEIYRKDVSVIIDFFSKEFFKQNFLFQQSQEKLIFIVGMPRSGSTLVEQILCAHSLVSDAGENGFMMYAVNDFARNHSDILRFPRAITDKNIDKLSIIAKSYMDDIFSVKHSDVVVDKTLGNTIYIGLIHLLFPNAKFVHMKRHPVANCYGCYKLLFSRGSVPYAYSLEHLAAQYADDLRMMDHWKEVLPGKVFTVEYEALVANQEKVTRELLEYCELPWQDECLRFYDNSRVVTTASNVQVKQKIYSSAVEDWKKYKDYLGPLMTLIDSADRP